MATTRKEPVTPKASSAPARKPKPAAKTKGPAKATRSAKVAAGRAKKDAASLPNRVRQHREKADLTPKELAARIGGDWTASTVRRIERGARQATPEQMSQLADALAVPVADLGFTVANPAVPAAKVVAVGKRTRKAIATKADVTAEVGAILGA